MLTLSLVILIVFFILNYNINGKEWNAPSVIFSGSFALCNFFALLMAKEWSFQLQEKTFFVIISALSIFTIVSFLTRYFYKKSVENRSVSYEFYEMNIDNDPILHIGMVKKIFVLAIVLIIFFLYVKSLVTASGNLGLSQSIGKVYSNEVQLQLPFYMRVSVVLLRAVGYWFGYIMVYSYIIAHKSDLISLIIVIICSASTLLQGSRGVAVYMIIAIIGMLATINCTVQRRQEPGRKIKNTFYFIVGVTAIIKLFPALGDLLGRKTSIPALDYVSAYIGAEFYNLNEALSNFTFNSHKPFGELTFYSLRSTLYKYNLVQESFSSGDVFTYIRANGHYMGNVYTFLYPLIYDFNVSGMLVAIAIISFATTLLYESAKNDVIYGKVSLRILISNFCFSSLALAFFSQWLTNYIISTSFIYMIVAWILLNVFMLKIKIIS